MSTSFLDLLSGALGAVILLFVLVPKTTMTDKELIDQMKSLEIETTTLDSLMKNLAESGDTISLDQYLEVVEKVNLLQKKNKVMMEKLSKQLANAQEEVRQLQRSQHQLKVEAQEMKKELDRLQQQKVQMASVNSKSLEKSAKTSSEAKTVTNQTAKVVKDSDKSFYFGFEAQLSVVLNWDSSDVDVDLFLESDGAFVDGFNRNKPFGKFVKVPKKYLSNPTEVIIQQELVPGTYKVHAHLARPRRDAQAKVTGFVAMDLGSGQTKKYDFSKEIKSSAPPYHRRADGSTLIGELEVTENNISFIRK